VVLLNSRLGEDQNLAVGNENEKFLFNGTHW